MTSQIVFAHDCIILDACCIINLYASGRMGDILAVIPKTISVAAYVHQQEALYIVGNAGPKSKEIIDLQPFIEQDLLRVVAIEANEEANYINFAAALGDDGEAVTGAIAAQRDWALGTDDRAAIRFFRQALPHLQLISSLELIKFWADVQRITSEDLGATLRQIRVRGRYFPHAAHSLYLWWQTHYNGAP